MSEMAHRMSFGSLFVESNRLAREKGYHLMGSLRVSINSRMLHARAVLLLPMTPRSPEHAHNMMKGGLNTSKRSNEIRVFLAGES